MPKKAKAKTKAKVKAIPDGYHTATPYLSTLTRAERSPQNRDESLLDRRCRHRSRADLLGDQLGRSAEKSADKKNFWGAIASHIACQLGGRGSLHIDLLENGTALSTGFDAEGRHRRKNNAE